jgi:protein SCO1/2
LQFEQRLGARLPLQAQFRDEDGRAVRLGAYFTSRPVIVVLTYFDCPNLCGTVLSALTTRLRRIDLNAGRDFDVVVASIDPRDRPASAARKRLAYVDLYERPGGATGWHFLTGQAPAIAQLTQVAGFHYALDEQSGQYLHPAGIVLATPQGRIARYLLGVDFPERELKFGLIEASNDRIGSPADRLWLLCHRYDGATGKYGTLAASAVRVSGAVTLLVLGGAIAIWLRRERNRADRSR